MANLPTQRKTLKPGDPVPFKLAKTEPDQCVAWWNAQSNRTDSVRTLILHYIAQHGIQDVASNSIPLQLISSQVETIIHPPVTINREEVQPTEEAVPTPNVQIEPSNPNSDSESSQHVKDVQVEDADKDEDEFDGLAENWNK